MWNSNTSSPVTVFGAGKWRTNASESRMLDAEVEVEGLYSVLRVACRGLGGGLEGQKASYI
jgi:hypothetical protein